MFSTIKDAVRLYQKDMFDEEINLDTGDISGIEYSLPTMSSYAENILNLNSLIFRNQTYEIHSLLNDLRDNAKTELKNAFAIPVNVPITDQLVYFFEGDLIYLDMGDRPNHQVIYELLRNPNLTKLSIETNLIIKCQNSDQSEFYSFVRFLSSHFDLLSVYRSVFDSLLDNVIYLCLRGLRRKIEISELLVESQGIPDQYIVFDSNYVNFVEQTFKENQTVTNEAFVRASAILRQLDNEMNAVDALKSFFATTDNQQLKPFATRLSLPYIFAHVNGPCYYSVLEEKASYFGAYINKISSELLRTLDYPYLRYFVSEESVRIACINKLLNLPMTKQFNESVIARKPYLPTLTVNYLEVFMENIFVKSTWKMGRKEFNPQLNWIEKRDNLLNETHYKDIIFRLNVHMPTTVAVEILARVFAYLNVTSILDCTYHLGEAMLATIPLITNISSYTGVAKDDLHPLIEQNLSEMKDFLRDRKIKFELLNELPSTTKAKCVYWAQTSDTENSPDPAVLKLVHGNTYLVVFTKTPLQSLKHFNKVFDLQVGQAGQQIQVFTVQRRKQFVYNGFTVVSYGLELAKIAATALLRTPAKYVVGLASDPVYNCVLLQMFETRENFHCFTVGTQNEFSRDVRNYLHRNNISLKYYTDLVAARAACDKANRLKEREVDMSYNSIFEAYSNLNFPELMKMFNGKRLILSNSNVVLSKMISDYFPHVIIDVNVRPKQIIASSTYAEQFITDLIFLTYLKDLPRSANDLAVLF